MKKSIAILLLGALLLLSMVGCLPSNNQTEGTTPTATTENTTPEVTIPETTTPEVITPEVTTPESTIPEVTTPEVTTPEVTTPEDNNGTNSPEDEVITFTLKPFLSKIDWMPLNNVEVTIQNEDIFIYTSILPKSRNYTSCYVQNLKCNFPDEVDWHVDADEQALAVYEQIKSSTSGYMISTSSYPTTFNPIVVYYIDGTYYFVELTNPERADVYYIYYATIGEAKLPLSDKNTISSYPQVPTTPPTPTESDPLVVELFGNELLEFSPIFFAQSTVFSSTGDKNIRVFEGNIYIDGYWYEISCHEDADIKYYDTYSSWGVEENEENMNILNTLKNSTSYYLLETQAEEAWYKKVGLIEIDGVYYFLELNDSNRVRRIHYANLTTPAPEQNLVVELFGDEPVEFEAPVFTMSGALSDASSLRFKVENGKINLLGIGNTYSISYIENATLTYPEDDILWWGVEKDEKALQAYETIKSSTDFYVLEAEGEVAGYQKIELYIIDGVYYFLTHASNPSKVLRIHYATIE